MALIDISNQYRYTGRGPFDAKSLIRTYNDLLKTETWTAKNNSNNQISSAYNGMLVAVWLNKEDPDKNGIYFLFDPAVTSPLATPDVTNEANWHKLAEISELTSFANRLAELESEFKDLDSRLTALEEDSDVITYGYRSLFPTPGEPNKLYVAADVGKSYIWFNNDYLPVGGDSTYEEPTVIYGGSAN